MGKRFEQSEQILNKRRNKNGQTVHEEVLSLPAVIWKMQIKTRLYHTPSRMLKMKMMGHTKYWRGCRTTSILDIAGGSIRLDNHFENCLEVSIPLSGDSEIPLLGI